MVTLFKYRSEPQHFYHRKNVVSLIRLNPKFLTQTFEFNSTCDGGQGLLLTEDYGAFESTGYTCGRLDVHDCLQTINYGLKVCNDCFTDETIYAWLLKGDDKHDEFYDLLENVNPEDVMLRPDECYYDTMPVVVDRYRNANYRVDITANATNPLTDISENYTGTDQLQFNWTIPTLPPTPAPSNLLTNFPPNFQ